MTRRVRVSRSGGFAGLRREREVDLDDDSDEARALAGLLDSERLHGEPSGAHQPDRFVYQLTDDQGLDLTVQEQDLPDEARELLDRALRG